MHIVDLNGSGQWSLEGIRLRYEKYAEEFRMTKTTILQPRIHTEGDTSWVYPVLEQVFIGMSKNDAACVQIAVDLVCDDSRFPFGKIYKDKAATLLRRVHLTSSQQDRLRRRIVFMLHKGVVPPEYKCYARLLRTIGLGEYRHQLDSVVPYGPRVRHYLAYFQSMPTPVIHVSN